MTLRPLLQEAWRNLLTGTSRAALLTVLLSVLSAGLAALEVISVQQISAAARTYVSSAASVVTLTAPGRISGVACDALDALPGVRAAGALRPRTSPLTAIELPSSPLPVRESSCRGRPPTCSASAPADGCTRPRAGYPSRAYTSIRATVATPATAMRSSRR